MKTERFNRQFEIDTTAKRGLKAKTKGSPGFAEALTGDGLPFNSEQRYYFFDESGRTVRQTVGFRRVDDFWLGSFGLRVVKIENLRLYKTDALGDGQEYFKSQIAELEKLVESFELEKTENSKVT